MFILQVIKKFCLRKCSRTVQGHTIYCYLSSIITYPPTCVFSLLHLFGFGPGVASIASTGWGSSQRLSLLFTSFHSGAREGSGAICLIGSFCLRCCDRASVISSRTAQDVRSLTLFRNEDGKSRMEIWPSAGASGNETPLKGVLTNGSNEMYSISSNLTVLWKF